jgi:hypothetical protein
MRAITAKTPINTITFDDFTLKQPTKTPYLAALLVSTRLEVVGAAAFVIDELRLSRLNNPGA